MMNLQVFIYQSKQVRTVFKDGQPWFVAKDICDVLNISDTRTVIERLDEDEWGKTTVTDSLGREQDTYIVTESGLYEAIFRSNKGEAKSFRRWVRTEVLPSIRKHGAYMTPETIEKVLSDPDTIIRLATELKQERQKRLELEPKAQSYDILMDAAGCLTMNEVAKLLDIKGIGQNNLFKLLVLEKIIYKKGNSYLPYQDYKPHFIVKQNPIKKGDVIEERCQLYMTTRGLDWLAHKLINLGYQVNYYKGKTV